MVAPQTDLQGARREIAHVQNFFFQFGGTGDTARAASLLSRLNKLPSPGTDLSYVVFPRIRATIELDRRKPGRAIEELRPSAPQDLGSASAGVTLYHRGLAYLGLRDGAEAATQFQRIIDNRGVVATGIYWPLAHLGLARARPVTGDAAGARTACQKFFSLRKTPVLISHPETSKGGIFEIAVNPTLKPLQ